MRLARIQSIIYNFYKDTMGFVVTCIWQLEELWMLVGSRSGFGMVSFGLELGRGQASGARGSSQAISLSILDTYGLVDEHSLQAHQGACSSVA